MLRALLATVVFAAALVATPVHADTPAAQQAATPSPQQVVKTIASELSTKLGDHRAELKNNRTKLIAVIDSVFLPHFDIDYASILVLGRHARQATPEQRERFAKAFYNSITHRYAEGLLNYTKGSVQVLPFKGDVNNKRTIVRTQVILDSGKRISVDYAFRKTSDGSWKAYDVIIEGISYITNYRNQVDAEIRKQGIEPLIKRLETQGSKALESMDKDTSK